MKHFSIWKALLAAFFILTICLTFSKQVFATQEKSFGVIPDGGLSLNTILSSLNTNLFYEYNYNNSDSRKNVFMVGKHVYNQYNDVSDLILLMDGTAGLLNYDFSNTVGNPPTSWTLIDGGSGGSATVVTGSGNVPFDGNAVKIHSGTGPVLLAQAYQKNVTAGQYVLFGAWVKTSDVSNVTLSIVKSTNLSQNFATPVHPQRANDWTYVMGYGQIPAGENLFTFNVYVSSTNTDVYVDKAASYVVDADSTAFQTVVNNDKRTNPTASYFIDNEPGWEDSGDNINCDSQSDPQGDHSHYVYPITPELYALVYRSFYTLIKRYDSTARVLNAGIIQKYHNTTYCGNSGYGSGSTYLQFVDSWRSAYNSFFSQQPPIDAFNIHYYEGGSGDTNHGYYTSVDLQDYLSGIRTYVNSISAWASKPIWISELGVIGSDTYSKIATDYLWSNNLGVTKWFWYSSCAPSPLKSLFVINGSGTCTSTLSTSGTNYSLQRNYAIGCDPKPDIRRNMTQVSAQGLVVTLEPGIDPANPSNYITSIYFGTMTNATITIDGQTHSSPFTYTPSANAPQVAFLINQLTSGVAATVNLSLTDSCHDSSHTYPLFFGKGTSTDWSPSVAGSFPSSNIITASPNPCVLDSSGVCSSTITLNASSSYTDLQIKVRETGGTLTAVGASPTGSYVAPWVPASGYNFDLYSGSTLLGSVFARGVTPLGTSAVSNLITASPNPCALDLSTGLCTTTITVNAPSWPNAQVYLRETGQAFTGVTTFTNWSTTAPWIGSSGYNFDLYSNNVLIGSVYVNGK